MSEGVCVGGGSGLAGVASAPSWLPRGALRGERGEGAGEGEVRARTWSSARGHTARGAPAGAPRSAADGG